jgi:hypothetical protein
MEWGARASGASGWLVEMVVIGILCSLSESRRLDA